MAGILLNRSRQVPAEETPAFGGIAERFRRGGDLDRAIALCRDGLKRFPDQLSARVTLGWALLDKGQYDAAREELEYVLRKAPDNLAAIRGLAELHDRTEGALPADESSWKSDDAPAAEAMAATVADVPVSTEPVTAHETLAPIPVHFDNSAAEVVHTAAQAEQDAVHATASIFDSAADLATAPIELEDPAAASMAAADPAPFFVVDPADAIAFDATSAADAIVPVPFEVAEVDAVNVEIETAGAAALAAVDGGAPSAFTMGLDVATPDNTSDAGADWAALTTLTGNTAGSDDASWGEASSPAAFDAVVEAPGEIDLGLDMLAPPALDENGEDVAAVFTAPQGLDDIDEIAGQELADAIKTLEEAAKRVEARLAPPAQRNEPSASPEDIAAFDFGASDFGAAGQTDDEPAGLDSPLDGGFELASPDLSDLTFAAEPSDESSADDVELVVADTATPQFDFDAAAEITDDASGDTSDADDAIALVAAVDVAAFVDAGAVAEIAGAPSAGESDVLANVSPASVAALLGGLDADAVDEVASVDALVSDIEAEDVLPVVAGHDAWPVDEVDAADAIDAVDGASNVIAWPDAPAATPDVDATVDVEIEALQTPVDAEDVRDEAEAEAEQAERAAAEEEEEEVAATDAGTPLAAMVETDLDDEAVLHTEPVSDADADIAAVASPVVHVYDVPVFAAAHAAAIAELADLTDQVDGAPAVMMGHVETIGKPSPLAALERFLRKVQARQLELRGENMA